MKSIYTAGLLLLTGFSLLTASCKKEDEDEDEGKLPTIAFKTGTGYTATNATVAKNTPVLLGITAAKAEPADVLTLFAITRAYDTAKTGSPIYTQSLTGASGDAFSKDTTITTRNVAGTEKYTFTVTNRDGLINSVNLTLTVQ